MPAPEHNHWVELWQATKEQAEAARGHLLEWLEAVREEPALIWATMPVRYTVYGVGGLTAIFLLRAVVGGLQVPAPAMTQPRATTAHFDVVCSSPDCGHHFVIERKFKFRKFPVRCPYCEQDSGQRALRCNSATCRGRLVMTGVEDGEIFCAQCGAALGRK